MSKVSEKEVKQWMRNKLQDDHSDSSEVSQGFKNVFRNFHLREEQKKTPSEETSLKDMEDFINLKREEDEELDEKKETKKVKKNIEIQSEMTGVVSEISISFSKYSNIQIQTSSETTADEHSHSKSNIDSESSISSQIKSEFDPDEPKAKDIEININDKIKL